ncbi:MAG: DUF2924 domain-containing protein, partial [Planctomycetes bacterium]|nr:DUF2924 domain-containing protein [Planctomycetota bacterium]
PRIHHREFLLRRCARKLEERRLGGLSPWALAQLERRMELLDLPWRTQSQPPITPQASPPPQAPPPRELGVVYERVWHGERIRVVEREGAFVWKGGTYTSLSAVARAVTGQHWNGRLFFGLRTRTRKAPTLEPKAGEA